MRVRREDLQEFVFGAGKGGRFTQDSPVMPDVWFGFGHDPGGTVDLLLEPRRGVAPAALASALRQACQDTQLDDRAEASSGSRIAYDESHVVAELSLASMVRAAVPLTGWWHTHIGNLSGLSTARIKKVLADKQDPGISDAGVWFIRLLGALVWAREQQSNDFCDRLPSSNEIAAPLARLLKGLPRPGGRAARARSTVWSINRNRKASIAIWTSTKTVKADAATRLFSLSCEHLTWAVLDTGIDATHPCFRLRTASGKLRKKQNETSSVSRVLATYDFTRIRDLLHEHAQDLPEELEGRSDVGRAAELRRRLRAGQAVDWEILEPLLRVAHDANYQIPGHPHGTHVAGILAANWRKKDAGYDAHSEHDMIGVCPDIRLYDLRVLDENGEGDEFSILAALQFIRYLNGRSRRPIIQGANLSLSIPHDVSNFACGRTPVCQEAERLHSSGVVVIAAAGNEGYVHYLTTHGETEAYQNISITDPGNAESVITVGATHRGRPHTYGVSYFSSRGPTGDGRLKPDLVAPGEKIRGPVPHESYETKDGTSMASPHVSGAAALIMSRHPEFIGDPDRIQQVLCETATDLGRERYFQGAGLVDICRALQSI